MENKVYFHCREVIQAENRYVRYTYGAETISKHLSPFVDNPVSLRNSLRFEQTSFAAYAQVVREYTCKSLTYQKDILNAFAGIAAVIAELYSCNFVAGLPEELLDLALLWTPAICSDGTQLERNESSPSWSWCGWTGEANYEAFICHQANFHSFFADTATLIIGLDRIWATRDRNNTKSTSPAFSQ